MSDVLTRLTNALSSRYRMSRQIGVGGARMTQTGLSLGTPQYMAPEQAVGERAIGGRADIYALGAVLYEMLVGEAPFTGPTVQAVVARVMTEQPRAVTGQRRSVPPNVNAAVLRALEKIPADRFHSADSQTLSRCDANLRSWRNRRNRTKSRSSAGRCEITGQDARRASSLSAER